MLRIEFFLRLLFGLLLTPISLLYAQSVKVGPPTQSVGVTQSVTYTATVTGLTSKDVTWSAGGKAGGNSTVGTITSKGVYTAPAKLPAQNPVTITATSKSNGKYSGAAYALILSKGPVISSVSPNPLSVGSITVTIKGTGFVSGAEVVDTYNGTPVQLSTTKVSADSITATGYQGQATSASFTVTNPGSVASNVLTVPVSGAKYNLTVVNGSGSGSYAAGTKVSIKANSPPPGQTFLNWTGAKVDNATSASTTLIMPASNTTVTANYTGNTTNYTLTVVNGSGSGSYAAGATVSITANSPPPGQTFKNWTGATVANANSASTTLTMPSSNTTVTANYTNTTANYTLTVVNGSGGGNYAAGATVTITANTPPPGQVFQSWTGATVANANANPTTLTMPASNTTVTATFAVPSQIPFPVTTHPRLWVTVNDLPRLQSWATASNPMYANGMAPVLAQAVNIYNTQFFPGGSPNPNYPDPGDTQGYTGYLTEQYGAILAFNSLIDPSAANRIKYAQYARNLLMYAMNQAVQGPLANAPFRDPLFPVYNRGNFSGNQWPLIVDWIYNAKDSQGNAILTASDKLTIRNVFVIWANECLNAYTTGGDHPSPVGTVNSLSLLPGNQPYRMASNNYYLGHARLLTMMGLCIDPADDPAINPSQAQSVIGNSLRSYILDANGAWLYQTYAMMGEPATVANAYGVSGNGGGFGLASGGMPPEGMLYGHSFGFLLGQLLALQTAGFNNVSYSGPQIQLINSPVWDRYVTGFLSSLTPTPFTPPSETYLGPVYQFASFGDLLRLYVTPDFMEPFALLSLLEHENGGNTIHDNEARWIAVNAVQGGAAGLNSRISQPWTWSSDQTILYYLLMDPAASAPTDPRPTYPTLFYDAPQARIVAHSDWGSANTMFDYKATWESINHQDGNAGQFEFYRNGEWLTKEMSNYDNNLVGFTTDYHNGLALQNWCPTNPPSIGWFETGEWALGSQWILGDNAGDPTTVSSSGTGYVYAASNLTPLYNRPDVWDASLAIMDVTQATRSIIWLNNDYIVVYDRGTTIHSGLLKSFNLELVNKPLITGKVTTETMADGQQLYIQTLLPANPTITSAFTAGNLNPISELEPTQYTLTVQDPSLPSDTRFLHVLQGANHGVPMSGAVYLQSGSGTAFDGAAFATTAIYFPVSASGAFTTTTFLAPTGAHTLYVAGLSPNTAYGVTTATGANGTVLTVAPGGKGYTTDGAGLLKLSF